MPTYLLTNETIDTLPLWKLLEENLSPSEDLTTSMNFPKNSDVLDVIEPGVEITASLTNLPTTFSKKGWRSGKPLNGDFDAGTWTFECVLDATKYANVDITLHARLWKSTNPDGTGATAISDWATSATLHISDKETNKIYSWSVTLSAINFSNEYLFVEFCMDVGPTISGDAAGATILFTCDESPDTTTRELLTTPPFTPAAVLIQISDVISLSDTPYTDKTFVFSDSVNLSDAVYTDKSIPISDSVNLSDLIFVYKLKEVFDSISLSDVILVNKNLLISDTADLIDVIFVNKDLIISENINLSDTPFVYKLKEILDSIVLTDTVITDKELLITNNIALTDVIKINKDLFISDSIDITDIAKTDKNLILQDAITLLDTLSIDKLLFIFDSIKLVDSINIDKILEITDLLNLIETVVLSKYVTIDDTVTLSESVSIPKKTMSKKIPMPKKRRRLRLPPKETPIIFEFGIFGLPFVIVSKSYALQALVVREALLFLNSLGSFVSSLRFEYQVSGKMIRYLSSLLGVTSDFLYSKLSEKYLIKGKKDFTRFLIWLLEDE